MYSLGMNRNKKGFTIVELLVVIVIIGILAAITIISYSGIQMRAIAASLQSDMYNAVTQLKMFQVDNDAYPQTINCAIPNSTTNRCLKTSSGNSFSYSYNNNVRPQTYVLNGANPSISALNYRVATNSSVMECPTGFIIVTGSKTYNTTDFCVMKYEAKRVGATATPISQAASQPWVNISQTDAITNSSKVANCSSCHLIAEAEWMTIAQNVLSVSSNWSSGVVGTGYIYSGHNDSAPVGSIAASTDDSNGYFNETNINSDQRRTLTLNNGEVIWDFAGDVSEWTQGTASSGKPGIASGGYDWRNWSTVTAIGSLTVNPYPSGTGLAGSDSWGSDNGIGKINSSADDNSLMGFYRGGHWANSACAGVTTLVIDSAPSSTPDYIGFRVSK